MRLHSLQYLRAVAAIAVVWSHAVIQVDQYQQFLNKTGAFGVDIFFVISGFIMVYISKPEHTPTRFLSNRISRVLPLYWFFTLAMAALLLVMPALFKNSTFSVLAVIKSFLFIPEYTITEGNEIWPILAPGWSLNYEMYFYTLFALSLLAPHRHRIWVCCALITVFFLAFRFLGQGGAISTFYGDFIVYEFVFGMVLALLFMKGKLRMNQAMAWGLVIAGFALLLVLTVPAHLKIVLIGIPALMIVTGTLFCKLPENKFFVMLGDSSYSLYLCHIFTLGICRVILPSFLGEGRMAAILFAVISTLICIASGVVVHYLIDNWLLRRERFTTIRNLIKSDNTNIVRS